MSSQPPIYSHPWNAWPESSFPEGSWPLPRSLEADLPAPKNEEKVNPNYSVPSRPFYSNDAEMEVYRGYAEEYYRTLYPYIPILLFDRTAEVFDNPIFEVEEDRFKDPIYVPGYVRWNPDMRQLNRFGIESEQDATVTFADSLLKAAGIEDLEQELLGAVVALPMANRHYRFFKVRNVSKNPKDVISPFGDSFNVELALSTKESNALHKQFNGQLPFFDQTETHEPLPVPFFYDEGEVQFLREMVKEGYRMTLPTISLQPLDREKTQLTSPVRESVERVFKDPLYIPGHVQWNPTVFDLRKFGIEHDQEVLILFSLDALQEATGVEELRDLEGSLVTLDLDREGHRPEYEVLSLNYQSVDALSVYGHVPQVALTVNLYRRPWQSESKNAPLNPATEDEPFLSAFWEDEDKGHGIY